MNPISPWTDERVRLLVKLWSENVRAIDIGEKLGGFNKNQVIGKAHRLNLPTRDRKSQVFGGQIGGTLRSIQVKRDRLGRRHDGGLNANLAKAVKRRRDSPFPGGSTPKPPRSFRVPVPAPDSTPVSLIDAPARGCRYIVSGEKVGAMFCAARTEHELSSWCEFHHGLVYVQPRERRLAA